MEGSKRIHTNKLYADFMRKRKVQKVKRKIQEEQEVRMEVKKYMENLPQK
tara:strand:+ start:147 stop:296 length:150 start_codon:yes stop_codon:yes gene_type:complete